MLFLSKDFTEEFLKQRIVYPLFLFLFCSSIWASYQNYYYGEKFEDIQNGNLTNITLKDYLHQVLDSYHLTDDHSYDQIGSSCICEKDDRTCFHHLSFDYSTARKKIFGYLHLEQIQEAYYINCVYCQHLLGPSNFPEGPIPGVDIIPNSRFINTEHTWPQSRFSNTYPHTLQKSDLHALYPTSPGINTTRNNLEFGEVAFISTTTCPGTKVGYLDTTQATRYFEPPDMHKGNVARSIFYFSTRYGLNISDTEEAFLKKWHQLDPVDEFEKWRHEEIFKIQKVRNPYVDHPWMVELIEDF